MLFTHFPTQAWLYVHRWSRGDCNCMGPYFLRKEMTEKRFCLFIFQLIRRSGPKLSPMIMYFYYDICSRQVHLLFKVPRSQERDSRSSSRRSISEQKESHFAWLSALEKRIWLEKYEIVVVVVDFYINSTMALKKVPKSVVLRTLKMKCSFNN